MTRLHVNDGQSVESCEIRGMYAENVAQTAR